MPDPQGRDYLLLYIDMNLILVSRTERGRSILSKVQLETPYVWEIVHEPELTQLSVYFPSAKNKLYAIRRPGTVRWEEKEDIRMLVEQIALTLGSTS